MNAKAHTRSRLVRFRGLPGCSPGSGALAARVGAPAAGGRSLLDVQRMILDPRSSIPLTRRGFSAIPRG